MPELPEVETTCRGIRPHVTGMQIEAAAFHAPKLRWPLEPAWLDQLQDQTINQVRRRGKYTLLECGQGGVLIHLGMSGKLRVLPTDTPLVKHDHVELVLSSGMSLRLNDPRRFGAFIWSDLALDQHPLLAKLGPEPLEGEFTADYALAQAQGRKMPIKAYLMHNPFVVGVGNIYATEALFRSRIHPLQPAQSLTLTQWQDLVEQIKQVLRAAIEAGGTTLKDFTNSAGKPGYFQQTLNVYGKAGQDCSVCQTPIKTLIIAQRASAFCPSCQRAPEHLTD